MTPDKTIQLIYDPSLASDAERIARWLLDAGRADIIARTPGEMYFCPNFVIAENSVIVLISDEAVENSLWQEAVRMIKDEVRIIPVGLLEKSDYRNPEIVPSRIEEILFIQIDEHLMDNILDSLITDPGFYNIKNELLTMVGVWNMSGKSNLFLVSGLRQSRRSLKLMRAKLRDEDDPYLVVQLESIIGFLQCSFEFSIRLFFSDLWRNIKRGFWALLAVIIVVLLIFALPRLKRVSYASAVIAIDSRNDIPPDVAAIKLVEGLTNPFVPDSAKTQYYNSLIEYLDMNWSYAALGINYKWVLNGSDMTQEMEFIWTANGNGTIIKWNRKTGAVETLEKVSDNPLNDIAVTNDEEYFAVVDSEGFVFAKEKYGNWYRSEISIDIPFSRDVGIILSDDSKCIIVYNTNEMFVFSNEQQICLEQQYAYERVLSVEISNGYNLAAVVDDGLLKCIEFDGSHIINEFNILSTFNDTCSAAMSDGKLLFADSSNQLMLWDKASPDCVKPVGIILSSPFFLAFVNDFCIVYHDRNTGTHVYDFEHQIDVGACLTALPGIIKLSAFKNQVFIHANGRVYSEDVGDMLPQSVIDNNKEHTVFQNQADYNDKGIIRDISIVNKYLIKLTLDNGDADETVVIDGANRYFVGAAQKDESLLDDIPWNSKHYPLTPVHYTGHPTVVGLLDDGKSFVIGAVDGSFFELHYNGIDLIVCSKRRIPSHSAVMAIYQIDDCYYLLDADGLYWKARMGYQSTITISGAVMAVKEKLHTAYADDLFSLVSPEVAKLLDLKRLPGANGKAWE